MRFLIPIVLASLCSGCLASTVVDETLIPTAQAVWPNVEADALRGLEAAEAAGEMSAAELERGETVLAAMGVALETGDPARVALVSWDEIEALAVRGIQDRVASGEMDELVATVLYQRLVNFGDMLDAIAGRGGPLSANYDGGDRHYHAGPFYLGYTRPLDPDPHWRYNRPRRELGLPLKTGAVQ